MHRAHSVVVAAAFASIIAAPALGAEVHDKALGVRVTVPKGWKALPATAVEEVSSNARALAGQGAKFRYFAVLNTTGRLPLKPPYIILQATDTRTDGLTQDELAKGLGALTLEEIKSSLKGPASAWFEGATLGRTVFDRTTNRWLADMTLAGGPGEPGRVRMVGFVVAGGMAQVNGYTEAKAALPAAFDEAVASVRFDPGREWTPAPSLGASVGGRALRGAVVGGLGGALVGLVALAVKKVRGRA